MLARKRLQDVEHEIEFVLALASSGMASSTAVTAARTKGRREDNQQLFIECVSIKRSGRPRATALVWEEETTIVVGCPG